MRLSCSDELYGVEAGGACSDPWRLVKRIVLCSQMSNVLLLITDVLAYEACIEPTEEQVRMSGLTVS